MTKNRQNRIVSWFSCGAASAVATKLAISSGLKIEIFYCEVIEEHADNIRFLKDCEEWFGQKVQIIGNDDFERSTDVVFSRTKFLVGPYGARCTSELKKSVRWQHEKPGDTLIMGYTADEKKRLERLKQNEPMLKFLPILIDMNLSKTDCLNIIKRSGIRLPKMYELGYRNNNCIGCVKGQAGYWNKIRVDFPDRFKRMAEIERELNRKICKLEWRENGKRNLKRIFLDELPLNAGKYEEEKDEQCGIFCQQAEREIEI